MRREEGRSASGGWGGLRLLLGLLVIAAGAEALPLSIFEAVRRAFVLTGRTLKSFPAEPLDEYDFVVVGAGPAGSVIANRLTEVPSEKVLLLEAGPSDNVIADVPVLNTYLIFTELSWSFYTERQEGICRGLEEERCPWPSGRGAGGGSGMNAMIYTRGHYKDYDDWAAQGNTGWSYEEVLPYFRKSERVTIPGLEDSRYHGQSGNLSVGYVPFTTPLLTSFLKAGEHIGYRRVDYTDPRSHAGFSQIQATVKNGKRDSATEAFTKPIVGRPNFHLSFYSQATRVLIDPLTMRAYGVEYFKDGTKRTVKARKEVILSAGAFNSPQLLMLSGIGHRSHLEDMGIPVLLDLPVGDSLQEHIGMNGLVFLIDKPVGILTHNIIRNFVRNAQEWLNRGTGPLTSLGCEGIAFVKTKYANYTEDYPDLELLFVPAALNIDGGYSLRRTMQVTDALYNSVYSKIGRRYAFSIWPILLYPKSTGRVRLRDNDPLSKVRIYPNFLSDPLDAAVMVEGLKMAVELGLGPAFKWTGARLHKVPFPRCAPLGFGSDAYWECTVREMTSQFHHQCCTCGMGRVLTPRLRVYGTSGLRVADTSSMPSIVGGHTQATAYMIGEKAADLIKQDWGLL